MKRHLAVFVLFAGVACAQTPPPAYKAHFESCFQEARKRHYTGTQYNLFMERCMRESKFAPSAIPAVPPSTAPTVAAPAPTPAAPTSARTASCNKMLKDLGATGQAAKDFLQRCLTAK